MEPRDHNTLLCWLIRYHATHGEVCTSTHYSFNYSLYIFYFFIYIWNLTICNPFMPRCWFSKVGMQNVNDSCSFIFHIDLYISVFRLCFILMTIMIPHLVILTYSDNYWCIFIVIIDPVIIINLLIITESIITMKIHP